MKNINFNYKFKLGQLALFIFCLNCLHNAYAQTTYVIHNVSFNYKETPVYDTTPQDGQVVLKMRYAKSQILNPQVWRSTRKGQKAYEIDLVYTKYPIDSANWITPYSKLMTNRIKALYQLDPSLKEANIKWNLIAQTECVTSVLAKQFFHGFIIKYKPDTDSPTQSRQDPTLSSNATNKDPNKDKTNPGSAVSTSNNQSNTPTTQDPNSTNTTNPVTSTTPDPTKPDLPPTPGGTELRETNNNKPTDPSKPSFVRRTQTQRSQETQPGGKRRSSGSDKDLAGGEDMQHTESIQQIFETNMRMVRDIVDGKFELNHQDSIVTRVLNAHPSWKDLLVVTDWTGSMYQFGAQVLAWHKKKIQEKKIKHLVLFNDGNDYHFFDADHPKPVGKTGGIYYVDPTNIEDVIDLMHKVMESGDGGEIPENNLEAIFNAQQKYKGDYAKIIMIADNAAPIRDIALLNQIKEPIHTIVCGYYKYINPDYLSLAWKTGGSVYAIDREVNFAKPEMPIKKSGLKLGKYKYVLNSEIGRFEIKKRTSLFGLKQGDD